MDEAIFIVQFSKSQSTDNSLKERFLPLKTVENFFVGDSGKKW
jgi:hypothetical protein